MATFKSFEDIVVWQLGRELVLKIYALTRQGAFARDYGLKDQIQRAAVSVPSNIAEGFERDGNKEFVKFLYIAKGSVGEVRSLLYNARDLGYIDDTAFDDASVFARRISAGIQSLVRKLSETSRRGQRYERQSLVTLQLCNIHENQIN